MGFSKTGLTQHLGVIKQEAAGKTCNVCGKTGCQHLTPPKDPNRSADLSRPAPKVHEQPDAGKLD